MVGILHVANGHTKNVGSGALHGVSDFAILLTAGRRTCKEKEHGQVERPFLRLAARG